MKKFEKVSLIKDCTLEELFNFHLDTNNLKEITPKDTKVIILNENFTPIVGSILQIKTKKGLISTTWSVKIEKLQSPNIMVDVAIKSPFKYWKHSHIFTQKGNMCELKDLVEYQLPFGKLGSLFDFFVKKELQNMFDFRHEMTKSIFKNRNL